MRFLLALYFLVFSPFLTPRRQEKRSCFVYCPKCRRDLNGDDKSWTHYEDPCLEFYTCASCGAKSRWNFCAPTPLLLDWRS